MLIDCKKGGDSLVKNLYNFGLWGILYAQLATPLLLQLLQKKAR